MKLRSLHCAAVAAIAIALAAGSALAQAESSPSASPTPVESASPTAAESPTPTTPPTPIAGRELEILVIGLRNNHGQVGCSLFNSADGFPRDGDKVFQHIWAPIAHNKGDCVYKGLPPGEYAAVVYHDENQNRKFDMNAFGMPKEGYGFSRDAAALFDAPKFDAAKFSFSGPRLTIIINIRY